MLRDTGGNDKSVRLACLITPVRVPCPQDQKLALSKGHLPSGLRGVTCAPIEVQVGLCGELSDEALYI